MTSFQLLPSLKILLNVLSTTGCLDMIHHLEKYLKHIPKSMYNEYHNCSEIKTCIENTYHQVAQKLIKTTTAQVLQIVTRLLSMCLLVPNDLKKKTLSNTHHRMLMVQHLMLPYLRLLSKNQFIAKIS